MAQSGGFQPTYDTQPQSKGRWPLAGVFFLDLVLILIAVLVITTIIVVGFALVNSQRQGVSLFNGGLSQDEMLRLIGVPGIFATLLVQNGIFLLVPMLRVRLLRNEPLSSIGFRAPRPLRLIGMGLGLGVLTLVLNAILGAIFQSFGVRQNQAAQYPLFAGDYWGQAVFFLGVAILAPLGEETLFRGYAFNAFVQSWSKRSWGVPLAYVLSALLFAFAHSLSATEGVIGLLVPTFVMGLLFAGVMHRTGSLLPSIIAHGFNNGVALLALTYCINNPGSATCGF